MGEDLVKIELGCGETKSIGFIGVDRFPLNGVDVVCDINKGLPFDDNSVDVVLAQHALEHFDDLSFIMSEIYRVCKHDALIYVVSPYYSTDINYANFHHKINFNENTFRFFNQYAETLIPKEQWFVPHVGDWWGINGSDSEVLPIEFDTIHIEFLYYNEYDKYPNDVQIRARKAFSNVCDMIYYILRVNKSGRPLAREEVGGIIARAQMLEPPSIDVNMSSIIKNTEKSIIDDIVELAVSETEKRLNAEFEARLNEYSKAFDERLKILENRRSLNESFNKHP